MSDFITKEEKETIEYIYKYSCVDYSFEEMYECAKCITMRSCTTATTAFNFLVGFLNSYCNSDVDKKILIDHAQSIAIYLYNAGLASVSLDFVKLGACGMYAVTKEDFLKLKADV